MVVKRLRRGRRQPPAGRLPAGRARRDAGARVHHALLLFSFLMARAPIEVELVASNRRTKRASGWLSFRTTSVTSSLSRRFEAHRAELALGARARRAAARPGGGERLSVSSHTIKAGTTSKLFLILRPMTAGDGVTGLAWNTQGRGRPTSERGRAPERSSSRRARSGDGRRGLRRVDAELLPGIYQLGALDEMLAGGSTRSLLVLRFPVRFVRPLDVDLVR